MNILILSIHLSVTAAYLGILWLVQWVVYPQFLRVPEGVFKDYHAEHCRRMGRIVGPLFLLEGTTAILLAWLLWAQQPILQLLSLGLYAAGHALTFFIFVPLHAKLSRGGSRATLHRLIRLNWARVMVAGLRLATVILIFSTVR